LYSRRFRTARSGMKLRVDIGGVNQHIGIDGEL
jgi:hypothetical protein